MKKYKCRGNHKGHLCVLMSEGEIELVKELANKPAFICFNCGRVANRRSNLCSPMPLSEKRS